MCETHEYNYLKKKKKTIRESNGRYSGFSDDSSSLRGTTVAVNIIYILTAFPRVRLSVFQHQGWAKYFMMSIWILDTLDTLTFSISKYKVLDGF